MEAYKRYVTLMVHLGEGLIPKVHLTAHLLARMGDLGSTPLYSNFLDESLNKALKQACRNASQQTFEAGILCRMLWVLQQHNHRARPVFE